jgi:HAD superfamily hydrolase (TIGR01450 family)
MLVDEYDAFLIDLDGVVYVGEEPVRGALEALERLCDRGVTFRFVTNNSSQTRAEIQSKLEGMDIDVDRNTIVSAAWATLQYLHDRGLDTVYVVGTDSLRAELKDGGIAIDAEDAQAVVVGHDSTTNYRDLTKVTRLVRDHDLPIIAVNSDATVPKPDGLIPGVGAIVSAIETATGRTATVIGKPERRLFEYALRSLNADATAMIGDNQMVDVLGADRAGIDSILVTAHAIRSADGPAPDVTIPDLRGLFATSG